VLSSPTQGDPWVRQWAAAATDATYENTPAAIICHIYLPCPTSATTGR
jgi:hypothetical protein